MNEDDFDGFCPRCAAPIKVARLRLALDTVEKQFGLAGEDLQRERAENERLRAELAAVLVLAGDAWGVIANAGHRHGGWETEHPEWREAATRWRDRFHAALEVKK